MSIPVLIRNPDGTTWEGHVAYKWSVLRKCRLELNFNEDQASLVVAVHELYGVCPALQIAPSMAGGLDPVYKFLYGYSFEELMEVEKSGSYGMPDTYVHEPQIWTSQMVMSMDWDLFCLAYYTFLCSNNDFESEAWKVLNFILKTLKDTPSILPSLLSNCGRETGSNACTDFWDTVCHGLQTKIRGWLREESCHTAYYAMSAVRTLFSPEAYQAFEKSCCEFFDRVARARIDEVYEKDYSLEELHSFHIESLFFYEDYFALPSSPAETRQYVLNRAFTFLHSIADKVAAREKMVDADMLYEAALQFAQTGSDRELIASKRNRIAPAVSIEKAAEERARLEREKQWQKKKRKDAAKDKLAIILIAAFLISTPISVLSGLLFFIGAFLPFSKTVFYISLCITLPFLLLVAVAFIMEKRK